MLVCSGCGGWVDPAVWGWCPDCGCLLHDLGPAPRLGGEADLGPGPHFGGSEFDLRLPAGGDDGFAVDWAQPA